MSIEEQSPKQESEDEKATRLYEVFVSGGYFDRIPSGKIEIDDLVAIRQNHLIYRVYRIEGNKVMVGYDADDGGKVRLEVDINDVRDMEASQTAYLEFMGRGDLESERIKGDKYGIRYKETGDETTFH